MSNVLDHCGLDRPRVTEPGNLVFLTTTRDHPTHPPKPEGLTEYSRRQSPSRPAGRAPPPVSRPSKPMCPDGAQEFFANLKSSPFAATWRFIPPHAVSGTEVLRPRWAGSDGFMAWQ